MEPLQQLLIQALMAPQKYADFRRSPNIEDRRAEYDSLPKGPFGTPGLIENNVFTKGDGTMVALNPNQDFSPAFGPNPLSSQLGVNDLAAMLKVGGQR